MKLFGSDVKVVFQAWRALYALTSLVFGGRSGGRGGEEAPRDGWERIDTIVRMHKRVCGLFFILEIGDNNGGV